MRRLLYVLLGATLLGACNSDDDYDPTVATNLLEVKGDDQTGEAGASLPDSLTVQAINLEGDPVAGVTVQWYVITGGGSLSSTTSVTNETGVAQVNFVLGEFVGAQSAQAVAGSLSGSPITFSATARAPGGGGGGGGGGDGPEASLRSPAAAGR